VPDEFTNLQIFPKDVGKRELISTMRRFADALGVRCNYCHAGPDNLEGTDFAADKLETKRVFWLSGSRMAPADRSNPDSYKVRRGKVGGYRDYFDDGQIARIDAIIGDRLSPFFGYGSVQDLEPAANG